MVCKLNFLNIFKDTFIGILLPLLPLLMLFLGVSTIYVLIELRLLKTSDNILNALAIVMGTSLCMFIYMYY